MTQNGIEVRDLRGGGWFSIENQVIDDHGAELGAYGIAVYAVLCRFANSVERDSSPSPATIAKLIGCSKPTVIEAIKKLDAAKLISLRE